MSILLILYLCGFAGYETKSVMDYYDLKEQSRVVTKEEKLAIDTATNVIWPIKAVYTIKDHLEGDE